MFYNVENLFHPSDDSLTMDDDFTPEGNRHWSYYRYRKKIAAVAKVIIAAGEGNPPDIVGLCEIENSEVLSDLVTHPLLMRYAYSFIHQDSPDPRGIDVAFLYRNSFSVKDYQFHMLHFKDSDSKTRDILHVSGFFRGRDTVDFIVNHWTSRYGGVVTSASKRMFQAEKLAHLSDSLRKIRTSPLIIAMGDFNDSRSSESISMLLENQIFILPPLRFSSADVEGSYKYHGKWESIDHFLLSTDRGMTSFKGLVISIPHLLEPDDRYTGLRPARTYIGFSYHGGISDHLPILLDITK